MSRTVIVGELKYNDTLSFVDLSDISDTSDFLSKKEGGIVSGSISAYNLAVLSGNYI